MGRLSIIFAFLLSVAAAGGSYYLYQGWVEARTIRGVVEAKYDKVKEKMITVQSEKEKIAAENEQLSAKSEEFKNKADAMQVQVQKLQDEQTRVSSEKTELEQRLEEKQKMIAELEVKMTELEQKAKDAQAACGVTPADLTTDPLAAAQPVAGPSTAASDTTGAGNTQLSFTPVVSTPSAAPAASSTSASETKKESTETSASATPKPAASAQVVAPVMPTGPKVLTVNRKFNFVVVNLGLQDGLKMGDRLKVLKQGKQVATVQVEKLYDKFSASTLVEENPKQQVVEGDAISRG